MLWRPMFDRSSALFSTRCFRLVAGVVRSHAAPIVVTHRQAAMRLRSRCENIDVVTVSSGTQCQTQYTQWLNLVEEQDTYRLYSQFELDISDSTQLHLEAFYAFTDVPEAKFTPSFTTTRRPTETVTGPAAGGALGLSNDNGLADRGA